MPRGYARTSYRRAATGRTARRRAHVWSRSNIALAATADKNDFDLLEGLRDSYGAALPGATVKRIRLCVFLEGSAPASRFHWGVIRDKLTTGVDDRPGPFTAPEADWMAYGTMYAGERGGLSTARDRCAVYAQDRGDEPDDVLRVRDLELPADIRLSASLLVALH